MEVWDILLIGVALSMDAVAVGMTDGMAEPRMGAAKALAIALSFAFFQFAMPIAGYYCGYAFSETVGKIAPWLSFALLSFIGGKMIFDSVMEGKKRPLARLSARRRLTAGKLLVQSVATSLDALAVGVTLLAEDTAHALPFRAELCALLIGMVTLCCALPAVHIGRRAGTGLADRAEVCGGAVLIAIGIKILLEGLL